MNTPQFYSKIVYKQVNRMKRVKKGHEKEARRRKAEEQPEKSVLAERDAAESATNM